jgi:hypothetical protein
MNYVLLLLLFGFAPTALLWLVAPQILRRYKGTLVVIVILILLVSIPWEMMAIDRIWGSHLFNLPIEEVVFFIIDGLRVGTLALLLGERFRVPA